MMTRRFLFTAGLAVGFTLILPLVSARASAWANDNKDKDKDKGRDDDDKHGHDDDDDDEDKKFVTICENGQTEQVKRRDLQHELNEGATLGPCRPSPRR